jgi:hypothetical protein
MTRHLRPVPPAREPGGSADPARSKKRSKFVEIANRRIANAETELTRLQQCADFRRYQITPQDVDYIEETVGGAYKRMIETYRAGGTKARIKLPD